VQSVPPNATASAAPTEEPTAAQALPEPASTASAEVHPAGKTSRHRMSGVRLSIRPWGQVSIDGQVKGISPPLTHLLLTPGAHALVIKNENFPPVSQTITVPEKGEIVVSHKFSLE
jgi:hypothetical protein